MSDLIKHAMSFYTNKGWEPHQAAGIVGNLLAESGLNSRVKAGDNGTAFGIAQWRGERLSGLKQFASANKADWQDLDIQLAYVDHELNTSEKAAGDQIKSSSNVQQANEGMITYERPFGSNKGVKNTHNYSGRLKFSNQSLNVFSGGGGDASVGTQEYVGYSPSPATARATMSYDAFSKGSKDRPDIYSETQTQLDNQAKPYDNWFQEVGASFQSSALINDIIRWDSEEAYDPLFVMPLEQRKEITDKYPENYQTFLLNSSSEKNFKDRLQWTDEDINRQQKLSAGGGFSTTTAGLTAGLLDPVTLVAGLATGGFGVAAKGASLGTRAAVGAAYGASSNLAIDAAAKYGFDSPHSEPLMSAGVGAVFGAFGGALARSGHVRDANAIFDEGVRVTHAEQAAQEVIPTLPQSSGNLSAARNTQQKDSLIGAKNALAVMYNDESVPKAFGGGLRFDVTGQMTTDKNPLVRQIGYTFFEETVGTKAHDVIPDSVNTKFTANYRQASRDFDLDFQTAKTAFLKENDVGTFSLGEKSRKAEEFSKLVTDYIRNPTQSPNQISPAVKQAGAAFQRNMANVSKQLREAGFDIPENQNYVPLMANHAKIAEIDNLIGHENIQKFIYYAIKDHSPNIDKALAEKMAKGYWLNLRKAAFGVEDGASKAIHLGDKDAFKQAFIENLEDGLDLRPEELDKAFELLSGAIDQTKKATDGAKGISNLKKRTLLNYNFTSTIKNKLGEDVRFSMHDLFEDDSEYLMKTYLRKMLPRVEFAKARIENPDTGEVLIDGFKSYSDITKLKNMVIESNRKLPDAVRSSDKAVKNTLKNIDFAWNKINGIPVWDQSSNSAMWARRIKDSQFIRLMSNMGLNQVQESWKIVSMTGFRATLQHLPSIRTMVKSVKSGELHMDNLLDELSNLTGLGSEHLLNRNSLKIDDTRIGASPINRFERNIDGALDVGKQITSQISLMRPLMDFQQRWSMGAISQQMANIARKVKTVSGDFDLTKISKGDKDRLATLGMGDNDLKLLFKNLTNNATFDGNKITGVNLPKWDAEAVSKYRYFLGRYTDRLVQANDFGGLSKWMSHPVASMFIQFRPFVLGAWSKSTLHALNHGAFTDPKMLTLLLGEWAAGTATFMLRQAHQLSTDEGEDKFWEETMDPANLLKNGWARTASASVLPMFLDSMLAFTPAGPQFGNARSSGTATDAWLGSPVSDQIKSAQQFTSGTLSSLVGDEDFSAKDVRAGVRAFVPWGNWVPFTAALNSMLKDK